MSYDETAAFTYIFGIPIESSFISEFQIQVARRHWEYAFRLKVAAALAPSSHEATVRIVSRSDPVHCCKLCAITCQWSATMMAFTAYEGSAITVVYAVIEWLQRKSWYVLYLSRCYRYAKQRYNNNGSGNVYIIVSVNYVTICLLVEGVTVLTRQPFWCHFLCLTSYSFRSRIYRCYFHLLTIFRLQLYIFRRFVRHDASIML